MGYNADLYENYTVALSSPHGVIVVAVMLQIGQLSNPELRRMTDAAVNIKFGGINGKSGQWLWHYTIWPVKSRQMSLKVDQKWFHLENDRFRQLYTNCQNDCCQRLWKNSQSAINGPIRLHRSQPTTEYPGSNLAKGNYIETNRKGWFTWAAFDPCSLWQTVVCFKRYSKFLILHTQQFAAARRIKCRTSEWILNRIPAMFMCIKLKKSLFPP